jgi:hypothetical protein
MANPSIYDGTPIQISGSTPFGFYDNDTQFQSDGPKVANFVTRKLGYGVMDVELDDLNIYACFEEAVSVYAEEVYQLKIKDNYISIEGSPADTPLNNVVVTPSLNNIVAIAEDYGEAAGVGGNIDWYTGRLDLKKGEQVYDLQTWALASASMAPNDRIQIKRIFYESNPAVNQYYDPYIGGSINYQGATENFGWASYSPGLNFVLFPIYWDIQRIQEIEMSNMVRRSAFTFELINNKLRVFPIPEQEGMMLYFQYAKRSELTNIVSSSYYGGNTGLVTNPSNAPYGVMNYNQINYPGKQWIFEYTLALTAELLGLIRGKYTTVPIPGAEVTLNSGDLTTMGRDMKTALREKLRQDLEDMSRRSQLERKQAENNSLNDTLNQIPIPIFII